MRYVQVMRSRVRLHNHIVAAILPILLAMSAAALPALAEPSRLDSLFERLQATDDANARQIEREIWIEWSKSGSPAMDLLLERGRNAMAEGDTAAAIEHLTALIDHAPDFAEGWNARATAYYQAGEFGPAIADIGHTLTLNPRHFGALAGLGAIFEELERPKQALEVYHAALAINPHQAGVVESVDRLEAQLRGQDL